ncbi:MAG: hypothetical protein K0U72_01790 [Gammaproteobacteria bacterium]|nr:hypothetical protein [Gammaproteobacteria bacterium]
MLRNVFSAIKRATKSALIYLAITAVTLAIFDLVLIATDTLPPVYEYGDPDLGWVTRAPATGDKDACMDMPSNVRIDYARNEMGIRTRLQRSELDSLQAGIKIAAVGDSHSDQCMSNEDTHQGVLQTELAARGLDGFVFSNGVGRYSPLQAFLLFEQRLEQFDPNVLVLNLYTGNDFIDILRVDDRPHFVSTADGYEVSDPIWFRYADPSKNYRSRVAFIGRKILDMIGVRDKWIRLKLLGKTTGQENTSLVSRFDYISDIRRSVEPSVGYSGAYSAQFLNQQLYFHHFPASEAEAVRQISALMDMIRSEYPDMLLVMSPIPSYQLVTTGDVDEALMQTMQRLPIDNGTSRELEERLYNELRRLSNVHEWVFVDLLTPLRSYSGDGRLYNNYDYHVNRTASKIIGSTEASVIADNVYRIGYETD